MTKARSQADQAKPTPSACLTSNDRIDVCRGLFAFLVVAAHCVDISWSMHPELRGMYPLWLHNLLLFGAAAGVYWVIGFFVISGYCIQLSVSRATEGTSFPLRRYLLARLSRILPLYYLALLFAIVAEWMIAPARPLCWVNGIDLNVLIAQVFIIQNFTQTFGSFAPSWSITNEMFYYVFYGLLVWAALRYKLRPTYLGMSVCLVIAVLAEILHFGGIYRSPFILGTGLLFGLGTLWFLGALVAEHRAVLRRSRLAECVSPLWPLIVLSAIAMWYTQRIHLQVVYVVLGVAFALMLIRFIVQDGSAVPDGARRTTPRMVEILGLASYPTYLFHGPLVMLAGSVMIRWNLLVDWRLTWLVLFLVGVTSGIALGYLAERPIMRWRAGFLQSNSSPPRPAVGRLVNVGVIGVQQ
jgi:peptidoglycan/LPS O-acetylase OafA/YrhL